MEDRDLVYDNEAWHGMDHTPRSYHTARYMLIAFHLVNHLDTFLP